eukprot:1153994-Pelagomonas_calceolata.AAC.1
MGGGVAKVFPLKRRVEVVRGMLAHACTNAQMKQEKTTYAVRTLTTPTKEKKTHWIKKSPSLEARGPRAGMMTSAVVFSSTSSNKGINCPKSTIAIESIHIKTLKGTHCNKSHITQNPKGVARTRTQLIPFNSLTYDKPQFWASHWQPGNRPLPAYLRFTNYCSLEYGCESSLE